MSETSASEATSATPQETAEKSEAPKAEKADGSTVERFEGRVDKLLEGGRKGLAEAKGRVGANQDDYDEALRATEANFQLAAVGMRGRNLVQNFQEAMIHSEGLQHAVNQRLRGRTDEKFRAGFGSGDPKEALVSDKPTTQERWGERREKLASFREGYAQNQLDLARTIREIETTLTRNPDAPISPNPHLTSEQQEEINSRLEGYKTRRWAIKRVTEGEKDAAEVFSKLFGGSTRGKVEMVKTPVSIYLRLHDDRDYTTAYNGGSYNLNEYSYEAALKTGGARLGKLALTGMIMDRESREELAAALFSAVTIERAGGRPLGAQLSQQIYQHETQHAVHTLVTGDAVRPGFVEITKGKTVEETAGLIKNDLKRYREGEFEPRTKDEILAYFADGRRPQEVFRRLAQPAGQGGIYDYQSANSNLSNRVRANRLFLGNSFNLSESEAQDIIDPIYEKVFQRGYRDRLRHSINALWNLYDNRQILLGPNATAEDVGTLLSVQPLSRWLRMYRLLYERSGYKDLHWTNYAWVLPDSLNDQRAVNQKEKAS